MLALKISINLILTRKWKIRNVSSLFEIYYVNPMTEMGEYAVGAYLRMINYCSLIIYNQESFEERGRFEEIDVIGINHSEKKIYLCEAVTHLRGMLYSGGNKETLQRLKKKFQVVKEYSESIFPDFEKNSNAVVTICT